MFIILRLTNLRLELLSDLLEELIQSSTIGRRGPPHTAVAGIHGHCVYLEILNSEIIEMGAAMILMTAMRWQMCRQPGEAGWENFHPQPCPRMRHARRKMRASTLTKARAIAGTGYAVRIEARTELL